MKKVRYTANDDNYNAHRVHWVIRELIGFCVGFTLVFGMFLLVYIGWA